MSARYTPVKRKMVIGPIFPFDDLWKLFLFSPDMQKTCDIMESEELVFVTFVQLIVKGLYPGYRIYPAKVRQVMQGLRTHDMDYCGRFYVVNNLSRLLKVQELRLVRYKDCNL